MLLLLPTRQREKSPHTHTHTFSSLFTPSLRDFWIIYLCPLFLNVFFSCPYEELLTRFVVVVVVVFFFVWTCCNPVRGWNYFWHLYNDLGEWISIYYLPPTVFASVLSVSLIDMWLIMTSKITVFLYFFANCAVGTSPPPFKSLSQDFLPPSPPPHTHNKKFRLRSSTSVREFILLTLATVPI